MNSGRKATTTTSSFVTVERGLKPFLHECVLLSNAWR